MEDNKKEAQQRKIQIIIKMELDEQDETKEKCNKKKIGSQEGAESTVLETGYGI